MTAQLSDVRDRLVLETIRAAETAQRIIDELIAAGPGQDAEAAAVDQVVKLDAAYALARARDTLVCASRLIQTRHGRIVQMPELAFSAEVRP